ncbi:hypothetical protein WJX75_003166 [Coccomyxa subellipsoidea]|uniref:Glycoside hydrolase n=1 Tax=Coccomyxa subellipsoidea TaxID=248742 RepID=A0ABR2Z159_9CHLO
MCTGAKHIYFSHHSYFRGEPAFSINLTSTKARGTIKLAGHPVRHSRRSMHTPAMSSPDQSRRSFDSDEEIGRSTSVGNSDWEFLVGTAISVYQNSGGGGNNWSEFENQCTRFGQPTIEGGQKCGQSNNFWEYYEDDIKRVVSLQSTCFRLSLEWSRIEPEEGKIDMEAVKHYHDIFDCLLRNNLKPIVTLHHFVHPLWFDKKGGFTIEANIPFFVSFCETAFKEYHEKVHLWITFNECNVMAFCGWLYGQFPPALFGNFKLAGRHLLTQYRSHTAAYKAMKALPGGAESRIGIVHNVMRYEVLRPGAFSARWVTPVVEWLNRVWATDLTLEYFKSGRFCWHSPWAPTTETQDEIPGLDFVGMNYYGKVSIDWRYQSAALPPGVMTDMPFQLDALGLYQGLQLMSTLNVPVYITETGIADAAGDRRPLWLQTYIPEVERAVRDGYDVRGIMYWTLVDNFEWAHGFSIKFGLYEWAPGDGSKRMPRAATPLLAGIYRELPAQMRRAHARAVEERPFKKPAAVQASPQSVLELHPTDASNNV